MEFVRNFNSLDFNYVPRRFNEAAWYLVNLSFVKALNFIGLRDGKYSECLSSLFV